MHSEYPTLSLPYTPHVTHHGAVQKFKKALSHMRVKASMPTGLTHVKNAYSVMTLL